MKPEDQDGDIEMPDLESPEEIAQVNEAVFDARNNNNNGNESSETIPWSSSDTQYDDEPNTIFVIDTNFAIAHLSVIESIRKESALNVGFKILIPWVVVQELDGLSKQQQQHHHHQQMPNVAAHARGAIHWIHSHINNGIVYGQSLFQQVTGADYGDDAVLDCCLYFKKSSETRLILLTNDKNLIIKAKIHNIECESFHTSMSSTSFIKKYPPFNNNDISSSSSADMMDIEEPLFTYNKPRLKDMESSKLVAAHSSRYDDLYTFLDDVQRILIGVLTRLFEIYNKAPPPGVVAKNNNDHHFMSPGEFRAKRGGGMVHVVVPNRLKNQLDETMKYLQMNGFDKITGVKLSKEIQREVKKFNHLYESARMRNEFAICNGNRLFEPTSNYQKSLHLSKEGKINVWNCLCFWIDLWNFIYNKVQQHQQEEVYIEIKSTKLPLKVNLCDSARAKQVWKNIIIND